MANNARLAGTPSAEPSGTTQKLLDDYIPDIQDQLQHVDPPLHSIHRRIVSRWFTPAVLESREPQVREIAKGLISQFAVGGNIEILDAFAGPFPATVVADTIGIPQEHRTLFLDWKEEVIGNPDAQGSRVTSDRYRKIRSLFLDFIEERRGKPQNDMITTLVEARGFDDQPLDNTAILGILMLFLGGGQETTAKAITSGLRLLGERPHLQEALRATPEMIPAFVEEVLRYEPPVRGIFRLAVRDTTVDDTPIPEGALLQILWASGNRDDSIFPDADQFQPDRTINKHLDKPILTFGHGIHLCPGAPLARLQLRVAFEELLRSFSHIALSPKNEFRYFKSQILRGLSSLHLEMKA
ncbi:MAG: cytochrome P450 [Actinomycetes bacterium]